VEATVNYKFNIGKFRQQIILNYNYIDDRIKDENIAYTRYSLNSLKHQFSSTLNTQFLSFLDQSISFRLVERTNGESYNVVDSKVKALFNKWELFVLANNIFNTEYTETNLVPMPKSNVMFGVSYIIY
jgi:iron complex outermembrane receptor protein